MPSGAARKSGPPPDPPPPAAEVAYLFRHALLRDAAYQLQLPGDRARLHALAFALIEELAGGRAPANVERPNRPPNLIPHSTDPFAAELASHALASGTDDHPLKSVGLLYLRRGAQRADWQYRPAEAEPLWRALAEVLSGSERIDALRSAGAAAGKAGAIVRGIETLESAILLARESGDRRLEGMILGELGVIHSASGKSGLAETFFRRAIAVQRALKDANGEATSLSNLGSLLRRTGRTRDARSALTASRRIFLRLGSFERALVAQSHLASSHAIAGEFGRAERMYRQILRDAPASIEEGVKATWIGNLGTLYLETGRLEEATKALEEALVMQRRAGTRGMVGLALAALAELHRALGRVELVRAEFAEAIQLFREAGDRRSEGIALTNLGILHFTEGRFDLALPAFETALAIHWEVGNVRSAGRVISSLASLHSREGAGELALREFHEALAIHVRVEDRVWTATTLTERAAHYQGVGDLEAAGRDLSEAIVVLHALSDRAGEGRARCTLALIQARLRREAEARATWREGIKLLRTSTGQDELTRGRAGMIAACTEAGIAPLDAASGAFGKS